MAPKRESESIHEFLGSRYPSHRKLDDGVKSLANAGFHKLDELANVNFRSLRSHLSALFCIALRDYMRPDATDHVEDDCTLEWGFECTEVTVTLRQENEIPELPAQYSPIVPPDSEEEIIEHASDEEDLGEELEMMENAYNDLPESAQPGLLELKMYVFSSERSKEAVERIWCKTSGTKILERRSYVSVQESVQARWDAGVKAVLLVGVPGIGKTGFIIYMLLSLMKQRKAIALQTKGGDFFLFEPQPVEAPGTGEAYACLKLRNKSILYDPEVYLLVDGKMPDVPSFSCKSLLAATPKLLNFQDYDKDGRGDLVLLPVWSAAEIALAWQEIFDPRLPALEHLQEIAVENKSIALLEARKKLTLDVVKERYKKWGGTARFVLEKPHVDLDEVVSGLQSIQQTVELVGTQVADGDHPSHKVVHQRVKQGYASYDYMFASPYLSEAARKKLKESTSGALRLFLSFKGLAAHGVNGCKGNVFQHEFKSLARGVQRFKVRQVYEDTSLDDQEMVFNFGQPFEVPKLESLPVAAPVNQIIWPESGVEETIDAMKIVRLAGRLDVLEVYQVTLSSARHAHGLKYAAMLKVMHKLGIPPHRVKVYIVTTSELYPAAGYQNWRKSRNLVLRDERILRRLVGITQYVLDSGV